MKCGCRWRRRSENRLGHRAQPIRIHRTFRHSGSEPTPSRWVAYADERSNACHSGRSEESIWTFARASGHEARAGFFTSFRMTNRAVYRQRSEEPIWTFARASGHEARAGFFTSFRMTNRAVHRRRSEESIWTFARASGHEACTGFFTSFRMTDRAVHRQRSEESIWTFARASGHEARTGFFASLRMTNRGWFSSKCDASGLGRLWSSTAATSERAEVTEPSRGFSRERLRCACRVPLRCRDGACRGPPVSQCSFRMGRCIFSERRSGRETA